MKFGTKITLFFTMFSHKETPKCGLLRARTETNLKEGSLFELQFFPDKPDEEFEWLDGNGSVIKMNQTWSQYKWHRNSCFLLTLFDVREDQAGEYRVRCNDGALTEVVKLEVFGKFGFTNNIPLNLNPNNLPK